MAKPKPGEVNKSEELRNLLKANPNIGAAEAVETLKSRGIDVAKAMFYFVKKTLDGKTPTKKVRAAKAPPGFAINGAPTNGNGNGHAEPGVGILKHESVGDVLATMKTLKDMAGAVGGVNRLKEMLEVMA